jgi:hypothetical protein
MKRDRDEDIISVLDEREVGGRKLGKQSPDTQVAVILKLLNGLTDRLEGTLSILIVRPGPRATKEWWSFEAPSAFMVRTALRGKGDATSQAERGGNGLYTLSTTLTKLLVRPDEGLTSQTALRVE